MIIVTLNHDGDVRGAHRYPYAISMRYAYGVVQRNEHRTHSATGWWTSGMRPSWRLMGDEVHSSHSFACRIAYSQCILSAV